MCELLDPSSKQKQPCGCKGHVCGENVPLHPPSYRSLLFDELVCHFPYTVISLVLSFMLLAFLTFAVMISGNGDAAPGGYHLLFHIFHYTHTMFSAIGTIVIFMRYSQNKWLAFCTTLFTALFFCTLSDALLPAVMGYMLGVSMEIHICFFYLNDAFNLCVFLCMGILCGFAVAKKHASALVFLGLQSHFMHILSSALAALFYLVSFGFNDWAYMLGIVFVGMVGSVIIPCMLADVVVPLYISSRFAPSSLCQKK